jgi:predicted aspartyl protease
MSAFTLALCATGAACTEVETQQSSTSSSRLTTTPRRLELPASGVATVKLVSRVAPIAQVFTSSGSDANFILDTGASGVFVSLELALKWRLSVEDMSEVSMYSASEAVSSKRHAMVPSLFLGESVARNVDAWILDNFPPGVRGAIGEPLLFESVLILDGKASTATFVASEIAEKEVERRFPGSHWSTIPLFRSEMGVCVDLDIAGCRMRLLVDTGALMTHIDREAIQTLGLKAIRRESVRDMDASGDRIYESEVFRVEGLEFGARMCDFETPSAPPSDLRESGVAGLLGFDFMRSVPCVFDLPNGRMMVRDADPGCDAQLHSTVDQLATACFGDSLPEIREMAAVSTARTGRRRLVSLVAGLLVDSEPGVRSSAAAAIEAFAQEKWPVKSRVALAKEWWSQHQDEAEYHLPSDASK